MDLAQRMLKAIGNRRDWLVGSTGVVYAVACPDGLGWFRVYLHGTHIASVFDDGTVAQMPEPTEDSFALVMALKEAP